ncbi:MAG: heme exporter protein CcmB [Acidobacteriaceae bacterium]|nr:heme exporter protein CcmB [Acidobacteriaceae bacterium]
MRTVRQALSVARKDLALELRTKESLNAAAAFAVSILLLFSFAFDPTSDMLREFSGGLLWLVFAFAGALVFNRGFARELPNECLDALLASSLSPASLLLGKAAANLVMLVVVELLGICVFGIFYNVTWLSQAGRLAVVFTLATWGIAIVGAVFGALTVNLRLRELMLPVIVYPLIIPLLIGAIELTDAVLAGKPLTDSDLLWGRVLIVFDVVFTALALALADTILVA